MKKTNISRIIAALMLMILAAASIFAFAACKKDGDTKGSDKPAEKTDAELIIGKWNTELDMSEAMKQAFAQEEALSEIEVPDLKLKMSIEYKEDGTYQTSADKNDLKTAMDNLFDSLAPSITEMFKSQIAESANISVDQVTDEMINQVLAQAGIGSIDDFITVMRGFFDENELVKVMENTGKYELKDGKISMEGFLSDENETEVKEFPYTLKDNTLTIDKGDNEIEEDYASVFPMVFTKAN